MKTKLNVAPLAYEVARANAAKAAQRTERAIRVIRQRIFDLPEHKQASATAAIGVLKSRLPAPSSSEYHWQYAAE